MEKYVVSHELAEKLKAAGYPQNTQFSYDHDNLHYGELETFGLDDSVYAAPLSDELLEQLPKYVKDYAVLLLWYGDHWEAAYEPLSQGLWLGRSQSADKPADALAELWLWTKEQGYLDA